MALDPRRVKAAQGLTDRVAKATGPAAALALAESLDLAAPTSRPFWALAANRAVAAGQPAWAVALGQIGLGCAVDTPGAHAGLARLHAQAGDAMAAAFRSQTASRLAAFRPKAASNPD